MYIGKAKNLKKRVSSYFVNNVRLLEKTRILVSQVAKIETIEVPSEIEALLLEANYIEQYKPKYNARLTDGKRYPLIRITIKDKYPKVLIARRLEDKKSLYFGPFPNSGAVRQVLKTLRRIFPFQSVVNHPKRLCLYNHLDLCPCPQVTVDKEYRKNILHIVTFLKGNTKKVIKNLENERNALSKSENFEKASEIQKKIDSIQYVTNPVYQSFDYRVSPNLEIDLRNKELLSLKECLAKNNVKIISLKRIECFDISNISGKLATGSMVVFVNGEKDPSEYRRFKIRTVDKIPNDFAMIEEVLQRRMKHTEWSMPDLIIVDGGKGQVSAALSALKANIYSSSEERSDESRSLSSRQARTKKKIPVIGLAKREKTIIIPIVPPAPIGLTQILPTPKIARAKKEVDSRKSFKEISLPNNSPCLHLLMRLRDEAHRFAIFYHRKLRSKAFTSKIS